MPRDDEYLPPDDEYGDGQYPFDKDDYPEIWGSYEEATQGYDDMAGYFQDQGFSNETWFEMLNYVEIDYDEDGNIVGYSYSWESPDGEYSGSGYVSIG